MHWAGIHLIVLAAIIRIGSCHRGQTAKLATAAVKFCHEGRVYKASFAQCPGGLLLKPKFRHLPECICTHGIFLHKGSSTGDIYDGIIANNDLRCSEYRVKSYSDWTLFLPLAPPLSPFSETVTIIPFENGTDRLDYFRMRRYIIDSLKEDSPVPVLEEVAREQIFYLANRKRQKAAGVQIGSLCLNKTISFNDGVYVDDWNPSDKPKITFRVGETCEAGTSTFHISDPKKIYRYGTYFKKQCSLAPSCLETQETVFELPDLRMPKFVLESENEELQRLARDVKCDTIVEENVQLAEYFTRLAHRQIVGYEMGSNPVPFKIVQESLNVFKAVIDDTVVPVRFLDQVIKYFHYLYFDKIEYKMDQDFADKLLYAINNCRLNSREMHFVMQGCPAKVEYFKQPTSLFGYKFVKVDLEDERKYDEAKYDAIGEVVYKVANFVYNYCVKYLDPKLFLRDYFKKEVSKLLAMATVQSRWRRECTQIPSSTQYRSILPYGDINAIMSSLDVVVAAALVDSSEKNWIPRPERKKAHRKRRSVLDYEHYEIWNGGAYCLQLNDYPDSRGPAAWGILPDITRLIMP